MEAYAKIVGTSFNAYIFALNIRLGRGIDSEEFIDLGDDTTISRNHAEIAWNYSRKAFQIKCIGKNSICVDKILINKDSDPVDLTNKSAVRIGSKCFYFLLPLDCN